MDESEGTHGPVSEQVIAALFEKHHGPEAYSPRTGRLPNWYTDGMQHFYEIYNGKILSTLGYIDNGNYYILGGAFVNDDWKRESGYFGQPFMKLMNVREADLKANLPKIAGFKYTGPITPDRNQETYIEMMSKFYNIEPMDTKGIPEEMIGNFIQRYPGAWGIRKDVYNSEDMAKALWDWHSSTWWDIVKNTKQISETGIKTRLGTKPLTITDDGDCCEKFRPELEGFASAFLHKNIWKEWLNMTCEEIRTVAEGLEEWRFRPMHQYPGMKMGGDIVHNIMNKWRECENG